MGETEAKVGEGTRKDFGTFYLFINYKISIEVFS